MTPPFLLATDQGWKHRLGWGAIACGLGAIFALLRWGEAIPTEQAVAVIMGGNLLNLAAFVGMVLSIRCPKCRTRLFWLALSTTLGLRWYLSLRSCPTCGFMSAVAGGPDSPLPADAMVTSTPHEGPESARRLSGRLIFLAVAAVASVFVFLFVPSLIAERRAERARELLSRSLPCDQATRLMGTLGTRDSTARLAQTCERVQRLRAPQPVTLQFNVFTSQTFFFQVRVNADGMVGEASPVGIR